MIAGPSFDGPVTTAPVTGCADGPKASYPLMDKIVQTVERELLFAFPPSDTSTVSSRCGNMLTGLEAEHDN